MKRNKDEIRFAMEKNLSGLQITAAHRAAIREKIRGGEKMKRKVPLALVLAIVLALVSVTALAVSNWEKMKDYLETVRFLSYETYDWPLADKLRLVEAMREAQLDVEEAAYERLGDAALSDAEKDALCEQIIQSRYGADWKSISIEEFEWPLEVRGQSEENMREYDIWSDEVEARWEALHPSQPERAEPQTQAEITAEFQSYLTEVIGFRADSLNAEAIAVQYYPQEQWWEASYTITPENPGVYRLTEAEIAAGDREPTMLEIMGEWLGEREEITFRMGCDSYGRQRNMRFLEMEEQMALNMRSELTEVYGFQADSIDPSKIQARYLAEQKIWEGSYTITEENPGLQELSIAEREAGQQPLTMLEIMRRQQGRQGSFTFYCYYDFLNRYLPGSTLQECLETKSQKQESAGLISRERALEIARLGLAEKYGVQEKVLGQMRADTALYQEDDGSYEYYIEFVGYEYSENLARIWSYAARVEADTGELLAAVSRKDWNPVTGRKLTADASPATAQFVWAHDMQSLLRRAAGDPADSDWKLLYNEKGEYFYAWTLEEKAEFSRTVKPRVDQFLDENPEYAQYLQAAYEQEGQDGPPYYNVTRHIYGLPDEKALSQEKAVSLARQAVLERLAPEEEYLNSAGAVDVYYDVTNGEKPLWKVHFNTTGVIVYPEDPWGFFVSLDAYSGEIENCFIRTVETPMRDLM